MHSLVPEPAKNSCRYQHSNEQSQTNKQHCSQKMLVFVGICPLIFGSFFFVSCNLKALVSTFLKKCIWIS